MANCAATSIGETPSTYTRSGGHETAGLAAAADIEPLDASGDPDAAGKIGVVAIGMSNQEQVQAWVKSTYANDVDRNPDVVWVNGGRGGHTAVHWSDSGHAVWPWLDGQVDNVLTNAQVQIVHVMMTNRVSDGGAMTATQLEDIHDILQARYANLKLIYWSGINYTGYTTRSESVPEPMVYNDSLLIAATVPAFTIWSDFYDLWADGETPNAKTSLVGATESAADPLFYVCADLEDDGIHPSLAGRLKQAESLLERWRVDPVTDVLYTGTAPQPPGVLEKPRRAGMVGA